MTDHADTIRREASLAQAAALDALLAERQQLQEEREDVISEIGEYSEGLAPNDLIGAVEWLIAEETKQRIQRQQLQEERDELWQANQQLASDHYFARAEKAEAERQQAQDKLWEQSEVAANLITEVERLLAERQQLQEEVRQLQSMVDDLFERNGWAKIGWERPPEEVFEAFRKLHGIEP